MQQRVIDVSKLPKSKLKLIRKGGKTNVDRSKAKITLKREEYLVQQLAKPAEKTKSATGKVQWKLPYKIQGVNKRGRSLDLHPVIELDGGGMRPQGNAGGFVGRLFVSVRDEDQPTKQQSLGDIEMLITGEVETIEPRVVKFSLTNKFAQVELRSRSPRGPAKVSITPSFADDGTDIEVPIVMADLTVSATPNAIQGFGLETARVTVRAEGLPQPAGMAVTLTADKGSLESTSLTLDAQGTASTTIRSIGTGAAMVQARGLAMEETQGAVEFQMPWLFALFALIGGAVGSVLRWGRRRKQKGGRSLLLEIALGVLAGVLVSVAYAIGVNLLAIKLKATAGEAIVFVLSALGAFFGLPGKLGTKAADDESKPEPQTDSETDSETDSDSA